MVEVLSQVSLRGKRQRERMEKIRAAKPIGGIRVVPTDEKYRKILKHPNGMAFRAEGSVEWPNDRFTKRRIAEGVVKAEGAKPGAEEKPARHTRRNETERS
jgi:hypothetical protein